MEKITTRWQLIESLKDILSLEIGARDNYDEDTNTFKNFKIKNTIKQIKEDEEKHINLLNECISLLQE